jgi:hypothetical protein
MVRSSMPPPSGKDLQKWKTALFPVNEPGEITQAHVVEFMRLPRYRL